MHKCLEPTTEVSFLSAQHLSEVGADLTTAELLEVMGTAWRDIRAGSSFGGKAVLSLPEDAFWASGTKLPFRPQYVNERLGWKLSCLYSVNDHYGGVKVIGANAFNRNLGLPRSTSTILLLEKQTLRLLVALDGTLLSARRTGSYATTIMDCFLKHAEPLAVCIFGTGPIARAVIECLDFGSREKITQFIIRGRSEESAEKMREDLSASVSVPLVVAKDNSTLRGCGYVITATNARSPVFEDDELARSAVTLHLGGDEVPEAYLQRALRTGLVVCDDLKTVSRRNSQSAALHFSRRGLSLEEIGPLVGVKELSVQESWDQTGDGPICVTCVGLPMLDLYAAQASYEKYLSLTSSQRSGACGS